jgi:hypothetical protein
MSSASDSGTILFVSFLGNDDAFETSTAILGPEPNTRWKVRLTSPIVVPTTRLNFATSAKPIREAIDRCFDSSFGPNVFANRFPSAADVPSGEENRKPRTALCARPG